MEALQHWYSDEAHVLMSHAVLGGSIGLIMASTTFLLIVGIDQWLQRRGGDVDPRSVALAGRILGDCIDKLREVGRLRIHDDAQRSVDYLQKPVVRSVLVDELARHMRAGRDLRIAARLASMCNTVYCEIDFIDKKAEAPTSTLTLWPTSDVVDESEYDASESKKEL